MKFNSNIAKYLVIVLFIWSPMQYGQSNENLSQDWRPFIRNFSPQDYSAGAQNWGAVQDDRGIIYFANQQGVLQFDGINWKTISLGDEKAVFSLAIDSIGSIWCGSHDDMGYLKPDSLGQLSYTSIANLFSDSLKPLGRIRQLIPTMNGLFIRTSKYLFRYKDNIITPWKAKTSFYKMQYADKQIYIYENRIGLKVLLKDSLTLAPGGELLKNDPLSAIIPFNKDSLLIATWKKGLFIYSDSSLNKFKTSIDEKFKNNPIFEAKYLTSEKILLTGFNSGSYIIDRNGNLLQHFNKSTGIIDELCNGTLLDDRNGLWFCNNYGISRVELGTPFSLWGLNEGITTNVRFITRFKDKLIVSTPNKTFSITNPDDINKIGIDVVKGITNCWYILPIGDILLAATNDGVYEIINNNSRLLALGQKTSFYLLHSKIDSNKIYVGTEEGIALLRLKNKKWSYEGQIKGVDAEVRQIFEMNDGTLWLGTHNQGIIKSEIHNMEAQSELIKRSDGFQKLNSYRIVSIDDQIFFNSPLFPTLLYDENKNEFVIDTLLFKPNEYISRIVKDEKENIWVRKSSNDRVQILYGVKDGKLSYQFESFPYSRLIGMTAQFIYPEKNDAWFGTRFGLVKFDSNVKFGIPKVHPAMIRNVKFGDSTLYAGNKLRSEQVKIPELPYGKNEIRFEYSLPEFEKSEALTFQYLLDGYEDQWSEWTYETQKDYTNLFEGIYKFRIRGKDIYGNISSEDFYNFIVLPPWYRSNAAYILYFISLGLLIFAVDRIRTRQLNKKNKIEEERKLKQQAAIEKAKSDERQRVRQKTAADFHDELGHMLTKITLFTEMAKRSVKDNIGAQKYLKGVGDNASQLSSGMKDLIWTLDSNKDSLYDALIRIKDFGEVLFEHSSIAFGTTGFPEDLNKIKISMDMRRHLILIFKEVMNNCLKYSKCNNAEFAVIIGDDKIQIIFTDDGKGFEIDSIKHGNGLKNIKMRAQNMGAELKILSELGKTEVIISLNI